MKMELEIARNISASEAKTSGICSSEVSHATNYFRYSTGYPIPVSRTNFKLMYIGMED